MADKKKERVFDLGYNFGNKKATLIVRTSKASKSDKDSKRLEYDHHRSAYIMEVPADVSLETINLREITSEV